MAEELNSNTAEVVETVETTPEVVEESSAVVETLDAEIITEGDTTEETEENAEVKGEEDGKESETVKEADTAELIPIVFEETEELPQILQKVDQLSDKYELPEEVTAAINILKAKAEANTVAAFADYGDVETVKTILDSHNTLHTLRPVKDEVTGRTTFRPNTDIYVQELLKTAPDTTDQLAVDVLSLPSRKYQGLTKLQELNADTLAVEGDTVGSLMKRFEAWQEAVRTDAIIPDSDIPSFIPKHLHDAYRQLAKESRTELELLDPVYDLDDDYPSNQADRKRKLDELARQQRGIDAEREVEQRKAHAIESERQELVEKAIKAQTVFYEESQKAFYERLKKDVQFSDDPKQNTFEAGKCMTMLKQAFFDDADGEFARSVLAESGIKFDFAKAKSMVEDITNAAITLTDAGRYTDDKGNPINPVAVNRATREFTEKGRQWQQFADDILKQLSNVSKTGKAEDLQREVKKIKVQPKARTVGKTTASPPAKKDSIPDIYSPNYNEYWVERQLREEAAKAKAYS